MSNLSWYPGAALPPSAMYPWRATQSGSFDKYRSINTCTRTGGPCAGLGTLYNPLPAAANPRCVGETPAYFGDKGFYSPTVSSRSQLQLGTGPQPCSPQRGCLDPEALSYDKMALTHCQGMCAYKKPAVCVAGGYELPSARSCNECPGLPKGANPVAHIYDEARSLSVCGGDAAAAAPAEVVTA